MNSRHLIDRFFDSRERGRAQVLVTVFDTLGSTYSKAGSRMLIIEGEGSEGLISGGCLEGDLAERARRVLASNQATAVTYDLRDEADELFGLGIGCNGLRRVLLQPLTRDNNWEPMASIARVLLGKRVGGLATVIEPGSSQLAIGSSIIVDAEQTASLNTGDALLAELKAGVESSMLAGSARLAEVSDGSCVLLAPLVPIPRLLILGAGLDAVPLVNVVAELGWRVSLADHRPAYLEREGFTRAENRHVVSPDDLASELPLADYEAIVVMSHHLQTDREYLRQLADVDAPYLGLLGPPARRRRLLDELGPTGASLESRLRGPVGIDIGADSAESIALSIAAEMQDVLARAGESGFHRKA